MNQVKTGELIRRMRKDKNMTQLMPAEKIGVSDKTVSKWERGAGAPDISLLTSLSNTLGIDIKALMEGDLAERGKINGNIKNLKFYVCPVCHNLVFSTGDTLFSCCGKKLAEQLVKKDDDKHNINIELSDGQWYITSNHEMEREHYISFAVFLTGDTFILKKLYPQQDMETRIPFFAHTTLLWYCTKHGLYSRKI